MSVTDNLSLSNCIVIASLCEGLVTNFYVLLKHLKAQYAQIRHTPRMSAYHRLVSNMTVLGETRLALLLLGGDVVGDEGVVALLAEGVLTLHLLLVDSLLHLHQLLDTPHVVLLLLSGLLLLPGVELGLVGVLVSLRVGVSIWPHGVSELIEQSSCLSPALEDLSRYWLGLPVGLLTELLLLALLEILLLLQVVVLRLLLLGELIFLLVVILLLGLLNIGDGRLLSGQIIVQTKQKVPEVCTERREST